MRVSERFIRRNFTSGSRRVNPRFIGELGRRRRCVRVPPRISGMVDAGVDRVHLDGIGARVRNWNRCYVELSVGDVIGMLEVNFEFRIKLKCLFNEFVIRKFQNYLHVCVSFFIPL